MIKIIENLTFGLGKPCVMDIKIGKITYGLDASQAKIDRESMSYSGTKIPFGFSVLGKCNWRRRRIYNSG